MHEAPIPLHEVIILTALPLECKAVLRFLQDPQEIVHSSGTIYYQGTFTGIHRIWRVAVAEIGMGGVTAALEAEKAISFFRARVALFVGIAGGIKDVQRGDVVAATKIYAYESGKAGAERFAPRPELGHSSHALEQRARAEAKNDEWLDRLEGDRPGRTPQVYIGALAAGEKVLGSTQSDLARLLRETYGDTLAIEMEGHGFLHAVRVNQQVYGLVIRGISDLIDDKAEADAAGAQRLAARHAAAFAFQMLAKFTLSDLDSTSTRPTIWNVPFARNPFFTGRDELLAQLHTQLQSTQTATVSQSQAISGLGGIGKTQLAIEYAYRYSGEYRTVLWARADTRETLNASYSEIAGLLNLPQKDEQKQEVIVQAVKGWLSSQGGWLLILDNADELAIVSPFLPTRFTGHLLLTTRAQTTGKLARRFEVETMDEEGGSLLLLRRAGLIAPNASLGCASSADQAVAAQITRELGGLPLALDQAGAYIEETSCGFAGYQRLYQTRQRDLLQDRCGFVDDHPESVATTWSLSFEKVEQSNPAAADLLRFCAFLAPDTIPEELLSKGAEELGERLAPVAADPFLLNQAIATLRAYSLIARDPLTRTLTVHRLVQVVLHNSMPIEIYRQWRVRTFSAIVAALSNVNSANRLQLRRNLYPHVIHLAQHCTRVEADMAAEVLLQQVLALSEQELGPMHPLVAFDLHNLVLLYGSMGKYVEAERLQKRALAIREQSLGTMHPDTGNSLNNLAILNYILGRNPEAKSLLKRAVVISERVLGQDHPDTQTKRANYILLLQAIRRKARAKDSRSNNKLLDAPLRILP